MTLSTAKAGPSRKNVTIMTCSSAALETLLFSAYADKAADNGTSAGGMSLVLAEIPNIIPTETTTYRSSRSFCRHVCPHGDSDVTDLPTTIVV